MRIVPLVLLLGACGGSLPSGETSDLSVADGLVDAGTAPSVSLAMPARFSSLVDPSTALVLDVGGASPAWGAIQSAITVSVHGTPTRISGTFTHATTGTQQTLTLTPTAPLPAASDIAMTFRTCTGCAVIRGSNAGFSTGSHPRVVDAVLRSKDGQSIEYVAVRFSEPMDATSVGATLSVAASGPVAGTIKPASASSFDFYPSTPIPKSSMVTVTIGAAVATSGAALDPASWDSPTAVGGQFVLPLSLADATLGTCGVDCVQWSPTVSAP